MLHAQPLRIQSLSCIIATDQPALAGLPKAENTKAHPMWARPARRTATWIMPPRLLGRQSSGQTIDARKKPVDRAYRFHADDLVLDAIFQDQGRLAGRSIHPLIGSLR